MGEAGLAHDLCGRPRCLDILVTGDDALPFVTDIAADDFAIACMAIGQVPVGFVQCLGAAAFAVGDLRTVNTFPRIINVLNRLIRSSPKPHVTLPLLCLSFTDIIGKTEFRQTVRKPEHMQPRYLTVSSSGSSPWQLVNWHATPINVGFAVRVASLSSTWQLDITLDDPTGVYPSSAGPTIFQSSQVGTISGSSVNAIGAITQPIAAWRLTNNSSGGSVTVTALQAGIG